MRSLCVIGIFWAQWLSAQPLHAVTEPIESAMLVTERFSDPVNCFQHPSAFSQQKAMAGFVSTQQPFGLLELRRFSAAFVLPLPKAGAGLLLDSYGMEGYRESRLSLGYAKNLGKLAIGLQFNYNTINASGYGSSSVISAGAGVCWWVSDKLIVGISIMDPFSPEFSKSNERLAWVYKIGLGWELSDKVMLSVAIKKAEQQKGSLSIGLIYNLADHFYCRTGYVTESTSPYLSAGWHWKSVSIEASGKYHLALGFSPGLAFLFSFQKKAA